MPCADHIEAPQKLVQEFHIMSHASFNVLDMYKLVPYLHELYMFSLNKKQDSEGQPQPVSSVIFDVSFIPSEWSTEAAYS